MVIDMGILRSFSYGYGNLITRQYVNINSSVIHIREIPDHALRFSLQWLQDYLYNIPFERLSNEKFRKEVEDYIECWYIITQKGIDGSLKLSDKGIFPFVKYSKGILKNKEKNKRKLAKKKVSLYFDDNDEYEDEGNSFRYGEMSERELHEKTGICSDTDFEFFEDKDEFEYLIKAVEEESKKRTDEDIFAVDMFYLLTHLNLGIKEITNTYVREKERLEQSDKITDREYYEMLTELQTLFIKYKVHSIEDFRQLEQ